MLIVAVAALAQGTLLYWRAVRTPSISAFVYLSAERIHATQELTHRVGSEEALASLERDQAALSDLGAHDMQTYVAFIAAARRVARNPHDDRAAATVQRLGPLLIAEYGRLSRRYVRDADARRMRVAAFGMVGVLTILVVLLLAYFFVFRPADKYTQDALAREFERREHYRPLFESSSSAIVEIGADGSIRDANPQFLTLLGYRADEVIRRDFTILVTAGRTALATARMREMLNGRTQVFEGFLLCKGGSEATVEISPIPLRRGDRIDGIFMTCRDLTRERAFTNEESRSDPRLRVIYQLLSSTADVSLTIDEALRFGTIELQMPYGYATSLVGDTVTILHRYGPGDILQVGEQIPATATIGKRIAASARAVAVEDLTAPRYAAEAQTLPVPWKSYIGGRIFVEGTLYGAIIFSSESVRAKKFTSSDLDFIDLLSEVIGASIAREIHQRQLQALASRDVLTQLANRRTLEDAVTRALASARRSGSAIALHYIDLDDFKPVNDRYGHAYGDEVLVETARRLSGILRADDLLARLGGDEFVALQVSIENFDAIHTLATRLEEATMPPIRLSNGTDVVVTASIGTAVAPRDGDTFSALLRVADLAMYANKSKRKQA